MTQDIVLSYQKVVLVDPSTLHYNYYHKFAIHPLDTEAMSTYLETHFDGKIIKAFYLKDLEVLQFTNTYSVEHPDDIIYRVTGVYPDEPA